MDNLLETETEGGLMAEEVIVKDIRMSFISMVIFMVKWVIASLPALVILLALATLVSGLLASVFAGLFGEFLRGLLGVLSAEQGM
jgi:hypothetical protein